MKIAYCTWTDPFNKRSWSGIHYSILKSLERHFDKVVIIGPLKNKYLFPAKVIDKMMLLLFNKNTTFLHSTLISKEFSRYLSKKLKDIDADILFFPGGSGIIAYLKTNIPIVYLTDSTYESMIDYYQSFSNLLPLSRKMGNFVERKALEKSSAVIFASDWAKNAAINDYNCPDNKISVIPFGANIDTHPDRNKVLALRKKNFPVLKLLLVGVNWERKGCQLAYDTMCILNERGVETELTICGCKPPYKINHKRLKIVPFLDKNNPDNVKKIEMLYQESDIFIFPTRNECAGIVICEACSYGLPIITTDTGGVSTYVTNGVNGFTLPLTASADFYADTISSIISDKDYYYKLAIASRDKFENELNWDSWGQNVANLLEKNFSQNSISLSLDSTKSNLHDGSKNIFLISQPRSGSTLFQKLLHKHQEIATTGETWALLPILYGQVLNNFRINDTLPFDGPLAESAILSSISELNNPNNAIREVLLNAYSTVCSKHSNEQNAKYFLDKTPRYYYIVDEILKHFQESKILLLIRNPLSVLTSILNTWVKNDYFLLTNYKDDLLLAPIIMSKLVNKDTENFYSVQYENLINNPKNQIEDICKFLDIEFNPAMLKPDNSKKWLFGDQTKIYEQDQILKTYQKMNLRIKTSRDWRLHSDYLDYLGPETMKLLGYDYAKYRLLLDESKPAFPFSLGLKFYTDSVFKHIALFSTVKRRFKNRLSDSYKTFSEP